MNTRTEKIEQVLNQAYSPESLNVIDDSHLHAGHASAGSKGHFSVEIVAEAFRDKSLIERHRMIYATLNELIKTDIHALSIKANAPQQ